MHLIETLNSRCTPYPLLGASSKGRPFVLDLSDKNAVLKTFDLSDQRKFQKWVEKQFGRQFKWGISNYLEYRSLLLGHSDGPGKENRFYHLGIDIIVHLHQKLHLPIEGTVVEVGHEPGEGTFGGYAVIRHGDRTERFYTLYAHLSLEYLPAKGKRYDKGSVFARVGDFEENGNWFHHTHVQVLTQKAYAEGYQHIGYCNLDILKEIQSYCPNPCFVLRY